MKHLSLLCLAAILPVAALAFEPSDLEGYYDCEGTKSSYNEQTTWSIRVTSDDQTPHKLWFAHFTGLLNEEQPVYGIVSADGTTVRIPTGQLLHVNEDYGDVLLEGGLNDTAFRNDVSNGDSIIGHIAEADGRLSITFDSWFAAVIYNNGERSSWWYGAVQSGAVFTQDPSVHYGYNDDGIEIMIRVIDEEAKTCLIGIGTTSAIDRHAAGRVVIPETINGYTVAGIDAWAFENCSQMTALHIPKTVTAIGKPMMDNTDSLTAIVVDPQNTVYDSRNNCNAIVETATGTLVAGCRTTVIPDDIEAIGNYAFYTSRLTSIAIPASVKRIGSHAFRMCSDLSSVTIADGSSLRRIENSAFSHCPALQSFTIPDKVEHIGLQAFFYTGLKSIVIPASVTEIDMGGYSSYKTFSNCSDLESIVVEDGNPVYDSRNGCNAIIETATGTLLEACRGAFIPDGVTVIGDVAFCGLPLSDDFQIPEEVKEIRFASFSHCTNLQHLVLPEGLEKLGIQAFSATEDLKTIDLPSTLSEIGNYAFMGCHKLQSVTSHIATPYEIGEYTFSNYDDAVLYVPVGTKAAYQSTAGWSKFASVLEIGEQPVWEHLGTATVVDNFLYEELNVGTSEVYRYNATPNLYRLTNPYGSMALCNGYSIADDYNETFVLRVLTPGDVHQGITITQPDLVYFSDISTGYFFESYNAVIYLYHPSHFTSAALNNESAWAHSHVLSYQSSGVPERIQLAPYYYMPGVGGWNTTENDGMVIITFPKVEQSAIDNALRDGEDAVPVGCYSVDGRAQSAPQPGLNLVRMSDGRTVKVMAK